MDTTHTTTIPKGKRNARPGMPTYAVEGKRQIKKLAENGVPHRVCPFCTAAVTFASGELADGAEAMIGHLRGHQ